MNAVSRIDQPDFEKKEMADHFVGPGISNWIGNRVIALCNRSFAIVEIIRRFRGRNGVENISTNELLKAISTDHMSIILVDVRSKKEQMVSKILGSISAKEFESDPTRYEDRIVVPYCTVGGRSYLYAKRLVDSGVDCQNYRDGILGWCRAGLPLETPDGRSTTKVNTYWRIFGVPARYEFQKNCTTDT